MTAKWAGLWIYHGTADTSPHQMPGTRFEERHVIDPVAGGEPDDELAGIADADMPDDSRTELRRDGLSRRDPGVSAATTITAQRSQRGSAAQETSDAALLLAAETAVDIGAQIMRHGRSHIGAVRPRHRRSGTASRSSASTASRWPSTPLTSSTASRLAPGSMPT